jgi:hypothetical protein
MDVISFDHDILGVIMYMVATSATAAIYVFRLATRVAVLEAGHNAMSDLLQEIRLDIKELVAALHGSELLARHRTTAKKKP